MAVGISFIVAAVLIFIGIGAVSFGYRVRKMEKRLDEPFIDFFFRH